MLAVLRVVAIPDQLGRSGPTQIVNMPVGTLRKPTVMAKPGAQTARTKGATDIDIPAGPDRQTAAPADLDTPAGAGAQEQRIGTGPGVHAEGPPQASSERDEKTAQFRRPALCSRTARMHQNT